jgi:phage gp45-like
MPERDELMDAFRFQATSTDDTGEVQKVSGQGYPGESPSNILRAAHFGRSYHAPKGSHGPAISPLGHADKMVLLGLEHPAYRKKNLPEGAQVLYDAAGNLIFFNLANGLTISTASGDLVMTTAGKIYLGGAEGASPVMTEAGPSSVVFAKV